MKKTITLFLFITIFISCNQNPKINLSLKKIEELKSKGFQVFIKDNFAIKTKCELKEDLMLESASKAASNEYPFSAYIGAENEESFEAGVIINVTITDFTQDLTKMTNEDQKYFEETYLNSYFDNMQKANTKNLQKCTFLNTNSIEYNIEMNEMPYKAIIFIKNKKSYFLQVGSRKDLEVNYQRIKEGFVILD